MDYHVERALKTALRRVRKEIRHLYACLDESGHPPSMMKGFMARLGRLETEELQLRSVLGLE